MAHRTISRCFRDLHLWLSNDNMGFEDLDVSMAVLFLCNANSEDGHALCSSQALLLSFDRISQKYLQLLIFTDRKKMLAPVLKTIEPSH